MQFIIMADCSSDTKCLLSGLRYEMFLLATCRNIFHGEISQS